MDRLFSVGCVLAKLRKFGSGCSRWRGRRIAVVVTVAAVLVAGTAYATQYFSEPVWISDGSGVGTLYLGADSPGTPPSGPKAQLVAQAWQFTNGLDVTAQQIRLQTNTGTPSDARVLLGNVTDGYAAYLYAGQSYTSLNTPSGTAIELDNNSSKDIWLTGISHFSARPRIKRGSDYTSGIWYVDDDDGLRQFAGTKTQSTDGNYQEWGIWLNNAWMFYFRGNNGAWKYGTNTWYTISDARTKKDVRPFTDGLASIDQVKPVWYRYNGEGGSPTDDQEHVGVIAQELEVIAPYMVTTAPTSESPEGEQVSVPELKGVDNGALTYMLVNAVKELSAQNRELRRDVDELKRERRARRSKTAPR